MISTPTFSDLAVRKGAELNLGSSPMESASAESEPLISERLMLPNATLRPSAAEAFSSIVGRNWLTGIKNGATKTSTINTPTTVRTIFNVLFMTTSDQAGTSEDWVRRDDGSTDGGGWDGRGRHTSSGVREVLRLPLIPMNRNSQTTLVVWNRDPSWDF